MLFDLTLSAIVPQMTTAMIECLHVEAGRHVKAGQKLLDVSVDLSNAFNQDCPPISFFRLVMRESAWLRRLEVAPGQTCELGQLLALFSTEEHDELSAPPQRVVRTTIAGIVHHDGMWTGNLA